MKSGHADVVAMQYYLRSDPTSFRVVYLYDNPAAWCLSREPKTIRGGPQLALCVTVRQYCAWSVKARQWDNRAASGRVDVFYVW